MLKTFCYGAPIPYDAVTGAPSLQVDLRCPPGWLFKAIQSVKYGVLDSCSNYRDASIDAAGTPFTTFEGAWTDSARCSNTDLTSQFLAPVLDACGSASGRSTSCLYTDATYAIPADPCSYNTQDNRIMGVTYTCTQMRPSQSRTPSATPTGAALAACATQCTCDVAMLAKPY